MIEKARWRPKTSLGHADSLSAAKKCRRPKVWPSSWTTVSTCSLRLCWNIRGWTTSWCRPPSGKNALASTQPLGVQSSNLRATISKSQFRGSWVNRSGTAGPQASRAAARRSVIAARVPSGSSRACSERSWKRQRSVTPSAHRGTKPSEASSTISSGDLFSGVA